MKEIKNKFKSIRVRLFLSLCLIIILIISFLIIINNVVLETFYTYSKTKDVVAAYNVINTYYNSNQNGNITVNSTIETELNKIALRNEFDILIKTEQNILVFSSDKNLSSAMDKVNDIMSKDNDIGAIVYSKDNVKIRKITQGQNDINFLLLSGNLDNGYKLYIRIPVASIQENVRVSNNLLVLIGGVALIISGALASFISKKFTEPIMELNGIAKNMSRLDFSKKYRVKEEEDEVNNLGRSINTMSDKLEYTIKQLRNTNIELEKDIEEKSQIDEMRKQFISDVSHELKTPIALIQGYAEGLIENVNTDEESRKFYAEVILDESNKMDKLVKQLLELMKLEYGTREFNNEKFNVTELISEVIRKCNVMLEEGNIEVEFDKDEVMMVEADEFYIEQVITNYITNAIKHVKEVNGKKLIKVTQKINTENHKIRISIFNTGENIAEEDLERIWKRFYKVDSSRNREDGGSGIGLALVKAIMTNSNNEFGVVNKENGVEFYFELDYVKEGQENSIE